MVDIDNNNRRLGPVAQAREVHKLIQELSGTSESDFVSGKGGTVTVEGNQFGGFQLKLRFPENHMEEAFVFTGAAAKIPKDSDLFLLYNKPAPTPQEFCDEDVALLADILQIAYDFPDWEFAELEAGSIGGMGQLTDYEFVYETGENDTKLDENSFDDAIEKAVISMDKESEEDIGTIYGLKVDTEE